MTDTERLEHQIELAKLDNLITLTSKPGLDWTPAELAENGIRGKVLDIMGNSIPIMKKPEKLDD